jgi:hypothetical protein
MTLRSILTGNKMQSLLPFPHCLAALQEAAFAVEGFLAATR